MSANSESELVAYLRAQETPEERAARIDEADADNAREIDDLRGHLRVALGQALTGVNAANAALTSLTSNRVYDVDLAESVSGEDLAEFLRVTARLLRAAESLAPGSQGSNAEAVQP